eukprot:TRINITY_DN12307_c0_g2_i2.p3 TRINITY_DN12307_c0_g2~~TRINITY_DN12307_c0_g2_i2.p3  ORF type:complete len:150 (+),score=24.53 TRINITY_DN12307_c0_g2_i2:254-703(+)
MQGGEPACIFFRRLLCHPSMDTRTRPAQTCRSRCATWNPTVHGSPRGFSGKSGVRGSWPRRGYFSCLTPRRRKKGEWAIARQKKNGKDVDGDCGVDAETSSSYNSDDADDDTLFFFFFFFFASEEFTCRGVDTQIHPNQVKNFTWMEFF